MKYFWCDLETTGLDKVLHSIHQLAYIIEIDGVEKAAGSFFIKPYNKEIDIKALEKCGLTLESFDDPKYQNATEVYDSLICILSTFVDRYNTGDKFHFAGFNADFDTGFLRWFFEFNLDSYFGSWFWFPSCDVMQLAGEHLRPIRNTFKNFKLETLCQHLGIEIDAHEAFSDIRATQKLYNKIKTNFVKGEYDGSKSL